MNEEFRRKLEETGSRFCKMLFEAEFEAMNNFIELYKAGKRVDAARTLESLDFMETIAAKICVKKPSS